MAKQSKIARNKQRIATVAAYAERRKEILSVIKSVESTDEEKDEAYRALRKLPRDSSPTRVRNRCELTGRPRGVYRRFKLSRCMLRERANQGLLPGITKASW